MCGISGIISKNVGEQALIPWVIQMNRRIAHRGPDDEGVLAINTDGAKALYTNDTSHEIGNTIATPYLPTQHIDEYKETSNVVFAHRRLAIIDCSPAGHQPICDTDQSVWMVFNGEIYNYIELRSILIENGYVFYSHTDSEVVLAAYTFWGIGFTKYLEGMWALSIYDKNRNVIVLSRDRFGVKPLYFLSKSPYFAFCSEIKGFLDLPFFERKLNNQAIYEYLMYGFTELGENAMLEEIRELKPGENLVYDLKTHQWQINKYYQLTFADRNIKRHNDSITTAINKISDLLLKSVHDRLRSDVKTGVCLSGGIDSSVITGLISNLLKNNKAKTYTDNLIAFTSVFPDTSVDESEWAHKMVKHTDAQWEKAYPVSTTFIKELEDLVYTQEIPFISSSTYAQYTLMQKVAATGVKVTLDGQGADELFTGYPIHYASYMKEAISKFHFGALIGNAKSNFTNKKLLLKFLSKDILSNVLSPNQYVNIMYKKAEGADYIKKDFYLNHSKKADRIDYLSDSINKHLHKQFTGIDLKVLLRTADRNSMRFSVESRLPFADSLPLIEYVFSLPGYYKIQKGVSKYVLREAAKAYIPKEIYNRKDKMGFATPERQWLDDNRIELLNYFNNDRLADYIDVELIKNNPDQFFSMTDTTRIWRYLNFAIWKKVIHEA